MTTDAYKRQTLTVSTIRNVNVGNIMQSILRDRTKTRSELAKENHISFPDQTASSIFTAAMVWAASLSTEARRSWPVRLERCFC